MLQLGVLLSWFCHFFFPTAELLGCHYISTSISSAVAYLFSAQGAKQHQISYNKEPVSFLYKFPVSSYTTPWAWEHIAEFANGLMRGSSYLWKDTFNWSLSPRLLSWKLSVTVLGCSVPVIQSQHHHFWILLWRNWLQKWPKPLSVPAAPPKPRGSCANPGFWDGAWVILHHV